MKAVPACLLGAILGAAVNCAVLSMAGVMPAHADALPPVDPAERLGSVSFPVSCAPAVQSAFSRGVALLHDF